MPAQFRIQHVNVLVDALGPAVSFYRDLLGFETMSTPEQGFPSQFFRINESQQLHMNEIADVRPFRAHFCVVVEDFGQVFHRMKAADAIDLRPWGKVRRLATGAMQMFVRDPSGNLVEVASAPDALVDSKLFDDPMVEPLPSIFTMSRRSVETEPRP